MAHTRIAVTGGAGFIGTALIKGLQSIKLDAFAIDIASKDDIETKIASVFDLEALTKVLAGTDVMFHFAGPVAGKATENRASNWRLQIQGTLNALIAANAAGVKKIILASSFYLYTGADQEAEEVTEITPVQVTSTDLFGGSKYISEQMLFHYCQSFGIEPVALRFGSVYGPGPSSNLVGTFLKSALNTTPVQVWGTGCRKNQYTYLGDIVDGCILSINSNQGIYNLVSPEQTTSKELAKICYDLFKINTTFDTTKNEGPNFPYMSSQKAIKHLGWKPVTIRDGLNKTWNLINHERNIK